MTIEEGIFDQESIRFAQFLRRQPMPLHERAELVRHIAKLRAFRRSGIILEAAECWLDKEIADLESDLRKAGNAA
ncbi:hypothetical protein [Paenibacillus sp. P22]|uniref:hypothetical protein n=1 Tax=Paenibacillus sp. P22 TaxID=483908 RepID=UPI00038F421E|nr:hypothetical protein [Paenibacillus sp. P22]CDN41691.1 hypothetical protein BN871_AJ_00430 [Paenibacillus sp. P22]